MAEWARLESVCTSKGYRGFESLSLRNYCVSQLYFTQYHQQIDNLIYQVMKKIFLTLTLAGFLGFSANYAVAQDESGEAESEQTEAVEGSGDEETAMEADSTEGDSTETAAVEEAAPEEPAITEVAEPQTEIIEETGHAMIKRYFIDGDWKFMSPVLLCLILGLGIAIGRIIVLMLNWINVRTFIDKIEVELRSGNVNKAKSIAREHRGPVASIYYQGLDRADEGVDIVEKSIVSYGSVQMGILEKGLVWISLFISLAPMLGFMGTVVGMILAFDQIEAMGDIDPSAVAGGIKVALLTTVAGLIVAIILQIFYNLITSIVDGLVNKMEDASITLVDMMLKHNVISNGGGQEQSSVNLKK